ncbi:MAG: aldehyde ferredoxin oxidoreductase family protein [Deltaproteobacteria bacterium]|nr:aldehyde ferredoxin oxidoreductase family protein [Deltaproteobacteria bacterium]
MEAYAGTVLDVDLTRREVRTRRLDPDLVAYYLGGRGLAVRIVWDAVPPQADPLGPENVVVLAAGPLTGFPVPGASRTSVVTKSPATAPRTGPAGAATLAIGQMPGHLATELRYAGFDAVILRGRAPEPVSLVIRDGEARLRPSLDLWGKEIPEAEAMLRQELPREPYQVAAIGPAGERLVPLASIVHSHPYGAHGGRGGIGAVWGSKKLKAIAVRGTLTPFDAARPQALDELTPGLTKNLRGWNRFETWRRYGTACLLEAGNDAGFLAVRNFREGWTPAASRVGAVRAEAGFWTRSEACFYCPLHCRKVARIRDRDGRGLAVAGPELETAAMLGTNLGLGDLEAVLRLKDRCDRLGLDPSSTGNLLGFLAEAADKGVVTPSHLAGVEPRWGDPEGFLALVDLLARADEGVAWAARGVRTASRELGPETAPWAMEVKGLEMDTYNPPGLPLLAVSFGTSPVGAAHEFGHTLRVQDERAVSDSLGLCRFHLYANPLSVQAQALAAVTGVDRSPDDLRRIGARIWNLERAFAVRDGFGPEDDRLPERCRSEPFRAGPRAGAVLDAQQEARMLAEYYERRGWTRSGGVPTPETLGGLGLGDVARALAG